jgi:hypothetical protein
MAPAAGPAARMASTVLGTSAGTSAAAPAAGSITRVWPAKKRARLASASSLRPSSRSHPDAPKGSSSAKHPPLSFSRHSQPSHLQPLMSLFFSFPLIVVVIRVILSCESLETTLPVPVCSPNLIRLPLQIAYLTFPT